MNNLQILAGYGSIDTSRIKICIANFVTASSATIHSHASRHSGESSTKPGRAARHTSHVCVLYRLPPELIYSQSLHWIYWKTLHCSLSCRARYALDAVRVCAFQSALSIYLMLPAPYIFISRLAPTIYATGRRRPLSGSHTTIKSRRTLNKIESSSTSCAAIIISRAVLDVKYRGLATYFAAKRFFRFLYCASPHEDLQYKCRGAARGEWKFQLLTNKLLWIGISFLLCVVCTRLPVTYGIRNIRGSFLHAQIVLLLSHFLCRF